MKIALHQFTKLHHCARRLASKLLFIANLAALTHDDAEQLEFAVQRGSFHPDKGRRFGNIAGKAAYLDLQIFALKGFSCLTQG